MLQYNKGHRMKLVGILLLIVVAILFLTTSRETTYETHKNPIKKTIETPQKAFDTPIHTYTKRIEAQNIANTIQSPNSYLGSRIDARGSAKKSLNESNKRIEEQNKAMDAFLK